MPRWLLKALMPLIAVALFLGGLLLLGRLTHDWLAGQDRATFALADADCPAPPNQSSADFVNEVQYLAGLPERVNLLDDELPERLHDAFARHPWVDKVERVEVNAQGVRVKLAYRVPVLAVVLSGAASDGKAAMIPIRSGYLGQKNGTAPARAVDGQGVLLPVAAVSDKLPVLIGPTKPPQTPPGTPWTDPTVQAAARTAALLRPHQERLGLEDVSVHGDCLVWSTPPDVRVRWGRPPGSECKEEASAAQKIERLLDYCERRGGLGKPQPTEHDVRPRDAVKQRSLSP
jgi:hypothetical protein